MNRDGRRRRSFGGGRGGGGTKGKRGVMEREGERNQPSDRTRIRQNRYIFLLFFVFRYVSVAIK